MRVCSWGISRNKSLNSTREQNQPCTKDISTTSLVPPSEVEKRWKTLRPYVNGFHHNLNFTWVISDVQLPFLDLCLKPTSDRLLTSIHYKETNTHSVLPASLTHHLILPVVRIPSLTVGFSVYNASVVRRMILKTRARKWQAFSEAVAIPQMLFSEPKNEYLLSLVTPLFQSVQM